MITWVVEYFEGIYGFWKLFCFAALLIFHVTLPGMAKHVAAKVSGGWLKHVFAIHHKLMVWLQAAMGLQVALAFTLTAMSVVFAEKICARLIMPDATVLQTLDRPMTSRIFLCWAVIVALPSCLFRNVSLPSIRDLHQLLKEQRDRNRARENGRKITGTAGQSGHR